MDNERLHGAFHDLRRDHAAGAQQHRRPSARRGRSSERERPLVIVTGSQLIAFVTPGDAPCVHDFRLDVKGFFEMAAISHLGPALASLVALSNAGADTWRADAERLGRQLRAST